MTAKEYLMQIQRLERAIRMRKEQIAEIRSSQFGRAINYDKPSVQTSPTNTAMIDALARIERIQAEIEDIKVKQILAQHDIIGKLNDLENDADGKFMECLYKRYVKCQSLEQIAEDMGYSYEYIRRVHGWALQRFARQYM